MDYKEARAYIGDAWRYAGHMDLSGTEHLLKRLGNPEDDLEFIHIAGTNGKGSVAAYIATVLQCAGYRVGRYISPTIYSYRERIQINGQYIEKEEFAAYMERLIPIMQEMAEEGLNHPTPFEIETVLSFLYFRDKKCDIVVLECGMGGATDATNVIRTTKMAVLTPISMDHVGILGNNLMEIAANKAGIIKPGAIVVMGRQEPEVENEIWAICTEKGNPFIAARPEEAVVRDVTVEHQTFRYHGREITISLAGSPQIDNAVLALECIQALCQTGFIVTDLQMEEGFLKTQWEGRFTVLAKRPYFIVDGAHNPDAAMKLKQSIQTYFPQKRLIFIMGMFADKDYRLVAELMAGMADCIFTVTPPDAARALPAEEFAKVIREFNSKVTACTSVKEAVGRSFVAANSEDVILSFGSLSFVGEVTGLVKERTGETE